MVLDLLNQENAKQKKGLHQVDESLYIYIYIYLNRLHHIIIIIIIIIITYQ